MVVEMPRGGCGGSCDCGSISNSMRVINVARVVDRAGYTQRNGLNMALQTCHQEFLEVLIHYGRTDDHNNDLLTAKSLESLHRENVSVLPRFTLNLGNEKHYIRLR